MNAPSCQRCDFALEDEDLRCALCGLATPAPPAPVVARARAEVHRCVGCGAAVSYSAEVAAPRCLYCCSTMRLEAIVDPIDQAQALLPFAVDPGAAQDALRHWLGTRGFFRPGDLAQAAVVEDLRPVWWPAWVFDVSAEVCWTADSDAGAHRAPWAPHAGHCTMDFADLVLGASRGLSSEECRALIPHYDLGRAVEVGAGALGGPDGAMVERFDVPRSTARRRIVEAVEGTAAAQVQATQVPGRSFRNVRVSVLPEGLTTDRYALPAYVLAYRYGSKVHRVVLHGQDPRCVVGDSPLSWWRIAAVALGITVALGLLAALLAPTDPPPAPPGETPPAPTVRPPSAPPPPPPPTVDRADGRCFVIESANNSSGTGAVFASHSLLGDARTWGPILRRFIARELTVLGPEAAGVNESDVSGPGATLRVRRGRTVTSVLLHEEGDDLAVCVGDPRVRDLLRAQYQRLNRSRSALERALR